MALLIWKWHILRKQVWLCVIPLGSSSGATRSASAETWPWTICRGKDLFHPRDAKSGARGPPAAALEMSSSRGKRTGISEQHGLHLTAQFCCSSGRSKGLAPASFLTALTQSRAYAVTPLSYLLLEPLTLFLGSLNIHIIKCCFSPSIKPKVYEHPPNHYSFLLLTHTAFSFSRCATSCKHAQHERLDIYASFAKI